MNIIWVRLSNSTFTVIQNSLADWNDQQKLTNWDSNVSVGVLSVCFNLAGTECLVKIANATPQWVSTQNWKNQILALYDESNHYVAIDLVQSNTWSEAE